MRTENIPESILRTTDGASVPLQGVSVRGLLRDMAAEITVEQKYTNPRDTNIEAVYTFPLPVGAVLLGLELEIGDRRLSGQIVEKKAAERKYEEAVSGGDTAVMLEESGAGLFTLNFGNLMAGESALIRYRYSMLLSWQGDRLRLLLPTTLAPRYGDPLEAGLLSHQVPETSLLVEYPFDLEFVIEGNLAECAISSPTHAIATSSVDGRVKLSLAGNASLDRDFVMLLRGGAENMARFTADEQQAGQSVALASLRIPRISERDEAPLSVKIMIDCSGSMAGVSIAQARKAALEILNQLRPGDSFNVSLFGSEVQHFWGDLVPAEARYISAAWKKIENLDANLGGTETGKALQSVYRMGKATTRLQKVKSKIEGTVRASIGSLPAQRAGQSQILLITDGQVWEYKKIIEEAVESNHRVFTVGVGLATVEGLVGELATRTGGACELVAPQEGMTESVLNQFYRLRQPMVELSGVSFETAPLWMTPLPKVAFAGDTVHVFAGFAEATAHNVTLSACTEDGQVLTAQSRVEKSDWTELPRMAAATRIRHSVAEDEQRSLALQYQLLTRYTNFLVVADRADKAEDLPELATIAHMLPAGWGGTGVDRYDIPMFCRKVSNASVPTLEVSMSVMSSERYYSRRSTSVAEPMLDSYDIPAFLRRQEDSSAPSVKDNSTTLTKFRRSQIEMPPEDEILDGTPIAFIANLHASLAGFLKIQALPSIIDELVDYGLPEQVAIGLREISSENGSERLTVSAFLMALMDSPVLANVFERGLTRLIQGAWKRSQEDAKVLAYLQSRLINVTRETWNWDTCPESNIQKSSAFA
jgi:Ca-activated chloride channel family protein